MNDKKLHNISYFDYITSEDISILSNYDYWISQGMICSECEKSLLTDVLKYGYQKIHNWKICSKCAKKKGWSYPLGADRIE